MELKKEIREYLENNHLFGEMPESFSDEASLLDHGIIDSMGVMELVSFVTTHYRIDVEPQDVTPENFDTIARLAGFIDRRRPTAMACSVG